MIKPFAILLFGSLCFTACKKEYSQVDTPGETAMAYTDLQNSEAKYGQSQFIDLDKDGRTDFAFGTILIGDPVLWRDRLQFVGISMVGTYVLADTDNNSLVLSKDALISTTAPAGYGWFEVQDIRLAEKITPQTGPPFWEGNWATISHQYLPLQVKKNGLLYNGWIELSMDKATEKLVLHRAALSTEAGKDVKAGR